RTELARQQPPFGRLALAHTRLAQLGHHHRQRVAALDHDAVALLEPAQGRVGECGVVLPGPPAGRGGRDQYQQEEQAKTALAATTHGISDAIDANAGWARARSRCHPSTSGWSGQRRAPSRATGRIPRTALVRTTASAVSTSAGASSRCSIG